MVTVGGKGRPVVGRVEPPEGLKQPVDFTDQGNVSLESNRTNSPYPLELIRGKTSLEAPGWGEWLTAWHQTPESQTDTDGRVLIRLALDPDGSFRIDDVPPGEYRVSIRVNERDAGGDRGPFGSLVRTITIPPIPGGRTDEPFDLGSLRLRLRARPQVGEPAPASEVATVDGKKLAVPGAFRGRFLLLDFGTMWDDQSRLQVVRMNDVFARFGKDWFRGGPDTRVHGDAAGHGTDPGHFGLVPAQLATMLARPPLDRGRLVPPCRAGARVKPARVLQDAGLGPQPLHLDRLAIIQVGHRIALPRSRIGKSAINMCTF